MPNIYAQDLPKNDANFAALTPLLYLERSALVYPDRVAIIHGALRQTWAQTYARCRQLAKEGSKLVYRCAKQRSEPTSDKRGAKADELHLTPLELIDRIAALVPPPRTHRHRYFGVHPANTSWCAMPTEDLLAHKRVAVHSACRTTVPAPRRSTCRDFRPVKKGVAGSRLRRPVDPR